MEIVHEIINVNDKQISVPAIAISENLCLTVSGKFIKMARIKDEWYGARLNEPDVAIRALANSPIRADVLTFWQRLPEIQPHFPYGFEIDSIAAVPISTYDNWFNHQIRKSAREAIRKAARRGVRVTSVPFSGQLIKGICDIYNETPIRQGRSFWHYGKDYEYAKRINESFLERSVFLAAHYGDEIIGFIKLVDEYYNGQRYTTMMQIVSKISHNDKAPTNALISAAVDLCASKGIPYLPYGYWCTGTLGDFKRNNGFQRFDLPRYYIPLTFKGRIFLAMNLQRPITARVPESMRDRLTRLRSRLFKRKSLFM